MKSLTIKIALFVSVLFGMLNLTSCNEQRGFENRGSQIRLRLDKFGDCGPTLREASHFIMLVRFESLDESNKKYEFQLHHGSPTVPSFKSEEKINEDLQEILLSMNCGDALTLRLPFRTMAKSYLSAYADETMFKPEENMELSLEVLHTFSAGEYANFLMSAAQQGELEEN
jgi:hypothetical protein